ncbi:MAG: hypothetical protein WA958_02630 [Tunicatimonas sp.]
MEEAAEITFYNILKKNFSEEDASTLVALQKRMQPENLATKADLASGLTDVKSVLTWRLFVFWLGQVAAVVAIVKYALWQN